MNFIKEWTICVCATLILSVIFSLLTPGGKLSGFYKIIISVFIFISIIYPFSNNTMPRFDFENIDELIVDESVNSNENFVNMLVKNSLEENDIIGASVSSEVSMQDDEIMIDSIQVAVPDKYDINEVKDLLFDKMSINARVIHIGS